MNEHIVIENRTLVEEVREGLSQPQKTLSSKYFYDERGSKLFEKITKLPEYYLTRTEMAILKEHVEEITSRVGRGAAIMELGSGSSKKTRFLFDHLENPAAYIPIDISKEYLLKVANSLAEDYPELHIQPVVADYTQPFELPKLQISWSHLTAFYPGSTVGNFEPIQAQSFLRQIAEIIGTEGTLIIGVDLKKDKKILEEAYNDAAGVTARFNKNILRRLNRELGADFEIEQFRHKAFFNENENRVEMHLVSQVDQVVHLDGMRFEFREGESIHTENSYKYSLSDFKSLVEDTFRIEQVWTDEHQLFSVQYLSVRK